MVHNISLLLFVVVILLSLFYFIIGDAIMTPGILDRIPDIKIKVEQVVHRTINSFERLKLIESKVKKLKK